MNNEDVLQKTLSIALERIAKKVLEYETEIANLNAQMIILASEQQEKQSVSEPDVYPAP